MENLKPIFDSDEVCRFIVRRIKHPSAEKSFLNHKGTDRSGAGFEEWKRETRRWISDLLHYSPEPVALDPIESEEPGFKSYTMRRVRFRSAEDCLVTAYLLVPRDIRKPAPAVVALHDHSRYYYWGKEKLLDLPQEPESLRLFQAWRYGSKGYASALAERGYVVLVIDALGWGERGLSNESWLARDIDFPPGSVDDREESIRAFNLDATERLGKLALGILYSGSTYMGILLWDDRRSLDYLCSLPFVDPERIGAIGLSMGGYRTIWLMAADDRVRCGCSVGFMTRLEDIVPHRQPALWAVVPGLYEKLPYPDLAGLAAPRDLLLMTCENDNLFSLSDMQAAVERVKTVYEKAGASSAIEARSFPVGHQFDLTMQQEAFYWFDRRLKPEGGRAGRSR